MTKPTRMPVFIVGFEQGREVVEVRDETGNSVTALEHVVGSEHAYIRLDVGGLLVRARIGVPDLNAIIAQLEVERDVENDPSMQGAIDRLDQLCAKLLEMRSRAVTDRLNAQHEGAVARARELLSRLDEPTEG